MQLRIHDVWLTLIMCPIFFFLVLFFGFQACIAMLRKLSEGSKLMLVFSQSEIFLKKFDFIYHVDWLYH